MNKFMPNPPWVHTNDRLTRLLLFFAALFILSSLYITVPLVPEFARDFQIAPERAALTGSVFSLFFASGCLLFGPLSDRLGRKRVIVTGLAVLGFATLGIGLISSFEGLLLLRCIQGAAAATFSPVALTYAGEVFPAPKRIAAISTISAGFLMAGIFGQLWASFFAETLGWHSVFSLLSAVYFATLLSIGLFLPVSQAVQHRAKPPRGEPWTSILANRHLRLCYLVAALLLLCFVGMYSLLGDFLQVEPYSLSSAQILGIRSLGLFGMLFSLVSGKLCAKLGKLTVLRGGLLLSVGGLAGMGFTQTLSFYIVLSILFVTGIAVVVPALISLVGEIMSEQRAAATSLYTFVLFVGASMGPILAIQLLKMNLGSGVPFLILAALLSLGLLGALFMKTPKESST